MKKLILMTLALAALVIIGRLGLTTNAHAQSVDQATRELATTETDLRKGITRTNEKAKTLQEHLATPDANRLPGDVEEFLTTTKRLARLRDELRDRITALDNATARTLTAFDQERALITDPVTRHAMTALRTQARRQANDRLVNARTALDYLGHVLDEGADVVHAARCVELAAELDRHNAQLEETIRRATDETAAYTTMTADLLGRLTNAQTE